MLLLWIPPQFGSAAQGARTGVQARGCVRRAALNDLGHPAHDAGERSVTERWSAQAAARSRSSASAAGISSRPSAWRRHARARQTTSATTRHGCGSGTSRSATHTELPLRRGTVTSTTLVRSEPARGLGRDVLRDRGRKPGSPARRHRGTAETGGGLLRRVHDHSGDQVAHPGGVWQLWEW